MGVPENVKSELRNFITLAKNEPTANYSDEDKARINQLIDGVTIIAGGGDGSTLSLTKLATAKMVRLEKTIKNLNKRDVALIVNELITTKDMATGVFQIFENVIKVVKDRSNIACLSAPLKNSVTSTLAALNSLKNLMDQIIQFLPVVINDFKNVSCYY